MLNGLFAFSLFLSITYVTYAETCGECTQHVTSDCQYTIGSSAYWCCFNRVCGFVCSNSSACAPLPPHYRCYECIYCENYECCSCICENPENHAQNCIDNPTECVCNRTLSFVSVLAILAIGTICLVLGGGVLHGLCSKRPNGKTLWQEYCNKI